MWVITLPRRAIEGVVGGYVSSNIKESKVLWKDGGKTCIADRNLNVKIVQAFDKCLYCMKNGILLSYSNKYIKTGNVKIK